MSTRCQIIINNKNQIEGNTAIIYQHCDGYPDGEHGVIPNVMPFLKDFKKNRGLNDLQYLAARLLQYLTNKSDKELCKYPEARYIGYGICNQIQGDIAYVAVSN